MDIVKGTARIGGQTVSYRRAGQGAPVLLLHCSSSHSGQWRALMEAAGDRYDFIAPDLLGYGGSGVPHRGVPVAPVQDATAIAGLLDHLGIRGPVQLVGHSMGGVVASHLIRDHGARFQSLTVIEPVLFGLLEELDAPEKIEHLEITARLFVELHLGRPDAAAESFIDFWSGPGAYAAMEPRIRDYALSTIGRVADDFAACGAAVPGSMSRAALAGFDLPTLVLCGEATRPAARLVAETVAATIPGARLQILPDAQHLAAAQTPDRVNPALLAFLDGQRLPTSP
ncbi:alpha/beta fold hydrolase [Chachezhania antarctica]|uniref:alpha/beta fold hydrolase n=1 Tax=Chachezhania antarctica TaxID=2340860 RepID=UPI000EAF9661|nr:alpha/beta hydrolase [Chachezhania antarctica]|tara:strand:- start:711 stop:1562 length:852 start_codon:yes stop_codon:yes gene_type:complete